MSIKIDSKIDPIQQEAVIEVRLKLQDVISLPEVNAAIVKVTSTASTAFNELLEDTTGDTEQLA